MLTEKFISGLSAKVAEAMTETVRHQVGRCLLDYLGCVLAGRDSLKSNHKDVESALDLEHPADRALALGFASHVLELDDGHRKGAIHVGGTVFSTLAAFADKLTNEDFVRGVVLGYEATIRLACAIQPGHKRRGFHATGTCGTVGAAIGAASALGYTPEQIRTTIAAAVTSAAGVLEMQEDGSDLKPLNVGRAAMDAVAAVRLGRLALRAPLDPLGGRRGFLAVMTDRHDERPLVDFSGTCKILEVYMKSYAACRHAHPAIEAALALRGSVGDCAKIKAVMVETYDLAVSGHDSKSIGSVSEAKMSMPFGVSLALILGGAGVEAYCEENVRRPEISELMKKISIMGTPEFSSQVPARRAARLTIEMEDGHQLSKQVDYPKGEPENPLSDDELWAKFVGLVAVSGMSKTEALSVSQGVLAGDFDALKSFSCGKLFGRFV